MTNDMPDMSPPRPAPKRRVPIAIGAVVAAGVVGLGAFYGLGGLKKGSGDPACSDAAALVRKIAPLAHGEVAAVTIAMAPQRMPDLAFEDAEGKPRKLSEW